MDEAHGYKNLRTASNIADAAIDGSMRASDLDMKIDYLRRRNGQRVVTFATATPIANSVTEAYVMQRYLRPDLLEAAGISVFDSWAATFGQVVTQVELAPEGGDSFRIKSRFARYRNVPELMRMWHVFADVKTAAELNLPVPALAPRPGDGRRVPETHTVEPSPDLVAYVEDLGRRADAIRNRAVFPEEDNMLKVSGDGRRAALDLRLAGLPQRTPGKIEAAAARIAGIWAAHRDDEYHAPDGTPYPVRGSLQIVFCDLGTPGPGWNAYDELCDQLAARSLPREQVRFVHEAKSDTDLARLFAACRNGNVAVLVGSTEKMGVGTNVQDRAIALHHLDAPWRPADVDQREGRIIRQGNLNKEVQVIRYITARSFDGYSWQTLERKARFIREVMSPSMDAREIGDIGDAVLSFSEAKALATNNPLLMDKAEADAVLARLVRAERAHQRNQDALRRTIASHEREITHLTQLTADLNAAIARRQDTRGDAFTMTIEGCRYRKRADAGQHLLRRLAEEAANQLGYRQRQRQAGELGGFSLTATITGPAEQVHVALAFNDAPATDMRFTRQDLAAIDPTGLITRLENRLASLEATKTKTKTLANIDHAHSEIEHAAASLGKPFPQAAELTDARKRCREIEEQLEAAAAPASEHGVEPEQPPPERPTAGMPELGPEREGDGRAQAVAGRTVHRRPPWPSAAEQAAGPTPTRRLSRGADREPQSLTQHSSSHSTHRDGEAPYPARQFGRGNDPLAGKPAAAPEREAGQ